VSTLLGILIAAASVVTLAVVAWAFIWAAKKDGEEDRTVQKRLGIRRRTRLGR
jgi:nitrogen fixation-related uncharacterized protein